MNNIHKSRTINREAEKLDIVFPRIGKYHYGYPDFSESDQNGYPIYYNSFTVGIAEKDEPINDGNSIKGTIGRLNPMMDEIKSNFEDSVELPKSVDEKSSNNKVKVFFKKN